MQQSVLKQELRARYNQLLASGEVHPDAAQEHAVTVLQKFLDRLHPQKTFSTNWLDFLFVRQNRLPSVQGFYLYGDVGRGKSMLMDLFFTIAPIAKKRRVHFHQFMLEIHQRLFERQNLDDIMPTVARDIAADAQLLCFDEFHVSNIADAMILARLFTHLFDAGTTIVCTSNWSPDELYKNGLQRKRFLPFIDLMKKKMQIYHLGGLIDHRFEKMRGMPTYFTPLGQEATRKLQGVFMELTDEAPLEPVELPVQGRTIKITHAAKGVGFFNFGELCTEALGASDYLAIAKCLHTLVLDDVPKLTSEQRNETLRFMTLIDALYELKVKFFMASAVPPQNLVPSGEHAFAFQRTVSRLMEMQSEEYRLLQHVG